MSAQCADCPMLQVEGVEPRAVCCTGEGDHPVNLLAAMRGNAPVAALAAHLVDLCNFHRDDPDDVQHADPIEAVEPAVHDNPTVFRLRLASGERFIVVVAAEP